ncbi:GNAT family N-acetyltransferase [Nocardioides bigeumensis]|uniref:N-acetyltransferase domain-containing protein n=1 Tax=Nocardioides bigeumensis TaxID=433657 RepID=A0ABP5KIU0_9ACTN
MHVEGPRPLAEDEAAHEDVFLRWQIGPEAPARLWRADDAIAVAVQRDNGVFVTCLGAGPALDAVVAAALAHLRSEGCPELRVSVPADTDVVVPAQVLEPSHWEWMWTSTPPPVPTGVAWLTSAEEPLVEELLAFSPRAHARPGDPHVRAWAGVRRGDRLAAAGALCTAQAGTPHLRAIVTHPDHRGQGHGAAVTAAMTLRGLQDSPVVTLGMYSDNDVARRIYHRLGYRTSHRWVSSRAVLTG